MGAFSRKAILNGNPSLIPAIADRICLEFSMDGYEVKREDLMSGGIDISITKGGIFKAVLGMKTALKVTLVPQQNAIEFEAGVGIFGQQIVPTVIMLFFAWPVLLTQIWGLVQQSKLDDKAYLIAQSMVLANGGSFAPAQNQGQGVISGFKSKFCTNCGTAVPENGKFCPNCGTKID